MASFLENINKIKGAAVHGPEMRTAIAEAITQAIGLELGGGSDGTVLFTVAPIAGTGDDFLVTIINEEGVAVSS